MSILCCSTASNVADAGGDDGSDDDEVEASQEQEAGTPDMDIGGETGRQSVIYWDFTQAYHATALNSCE